MMLRDTPRLRPDILRRDRLVSRLLEHPCRFVLVAAPAGFGKTTLVLDWLRQQSIPSAWLALEASDNDPRAFFAHIARALPNVGVSPDSLQSALDAGASPSTLAAHLVEDLYPIESDIVLVFDDYHFVEAPELHHAVAWLLDHLPEAVHVVMMSRIDPPFPLARLRLGGDFVEIRARDLRFTKDEARAFFERAVAATLDPADVDALEARTEGWAAGLQMAAISLRHEQDIPAFVRTFTGSHLYVVDYLLEEVIQRQPHDVQQFLLRTSILQRFDAAVCRTVSGMEEAPELLAEAERAGLFLVSLDDRREWYRYHHLFAELLAERLRRLHPEEWEVLHERASTWFEAEGDVHAALRHAGQMSSWQCLLELLERHGLVLLERSELASVAAWAARIPDTATAGFPGFLIARAWVHLLTERFTDLEPLLAAAEAAVDGTTLPYSEEEKAGFRGMIATHRAYLLRLQDRYEACVTATEEAIAGPAVRSPRNRGLLYYNLARTRLHLGQMQAARDDFEQALEFNWQARIWYLALAGMGYLGAIAAQMEGLQPARERLNAALDFARGERLDGLPACGILHFQLGRILFMQGEVDASERAFMKAKELGEAGRVPEVLSNALAGLVRAHGARREFQAARERLHDLDVLRQSASARLFDTSFETERAWLALQEGDRLHLDTWCASRPAPADTAYTTAAETANLLRMRFHLSYDAPGAAAPIIDWLCAESEQRGRRLTHLVARLGRALLLGGIDQSEAAVEIVDAVLCDPVAGHVVRPFTEFGEPLRELIEIAIRRGLSPVAEEQACRLLALQADVPEAAAGTMPMFRQPISEPLTEREQEVLFHLSRRLSYQQIADTLFVSRDTVKTHLKHVYAKLGATNRPEALERARRAGFSLADTSGQAGATPGLA